MSASPSSTVAREIPPTAPASLSRVIAGFAAVYLIWGSTYLAIRFAIETFPPLLMAGVRFLVAGSVLYVWSRSRGAAPPTRAQWRTAFVVGGLLLLGGNGAVVVAEQWVPSGLTALLIGAVPLWMVLVDWGWGSRVRPSRRVVLGLIGGFVGLVTLVGAPGAGAGGRQELLGGLLVVLGALAWAAGSIYSRHAPLPPRPRLWVAMQMLAGGTLLVTAAGLAGEWRSFDPGGVSARSALALLYLVVFGSLVAYTAYIWLLSVSTPARVGTYAYVNPVVALLLGWSLADEPLSFRSVVAAAIIVGAVVVTTTGGRAGGRPSKPAAPRA
jgi:drug/metabolite transporter (DMT)-like permease